MASKDGHWDKSGTAGTDKNINKGPGSKKGGGGGHSDGVAVKGAPKMKSGDAGASSTEVTHNAKFAEGGTTKMFGEQEAGERTGSDKSPSTGKPDSSGPGEKFAEGGKGKMFSFTGALPATAGITAPRES